MERGKEDDMQQRAKGKGAILNLDTVLEAKLHSFL